MRSFIVASAFALLAVPAFAAAPEPQPPAPDMQALAQNFANKTSAVTLEAAIAEVRVDMLMKEVADLKKQLADTKKAEKPTAKITK